MIQKIIRFFTRRKQRRIERESLRREWELLLSREKVLVRALDEVDARTKMGRKYKTDLIRVRERIEELEHLDF